MTRKTDPRSARRPAADIVAHGGELPAFTPVPRKCERHDGWTPERQRGFIEALADTGSVEAACKAVDMAQRGAYELRRQPGADGFRAAWEAALQFGVARVEDVAMDRALNGVEEDIFSYGKHIGTRRRYNDRLLMFILRNRAPERFGAGRRSSGLSGLNAVSQMQLDRLKKQWIAEHEASKPNVTAAEVRASIDRKIEEVRRRFQRDCEARWAALSEETRATWALFIALRDRDLAAMGADPQTLELLDPPWTAPADHFDPPAPRALPAPEREAEEPSIHPPEGWSYGKPKPAPPPRTEWSLKDEEW
ncbi:MAG: hypothetical protein ACKO1N_01370 [Erythrobacter sp.]